MKKSKQVETPKRSTNNLAMLLGIGLLIYTYRVLIGPLIISALIAYLLYPGVTWLSKRMRLPRRRIVPLVYVVFLAFLGWAIVDVGPKITGQANLLIAQLSNLPETLGELQPSVDNLLGIELPLISIAEEFTTDISKILKPEQLFRIIQGASENIVWVIIIFITSFHLLRDWERLREWLFSFSPAEIEPDLRRLHKEIKVIWNVYLRGQLLLMTIIGVLSSMAAALIGLPGALVLGFLAGGLTLIPSLGPAISTAIAVIVAWTQGSTHLALSNLAAAVATIVGFQAIQLMEGLWLTPKIMSRRMNLHPGLVLIAIVSTLFTLGTLMAIIIVPLIASLDLVFHFFRLRNAGLDPWPIIETQPSPEDAEELGAGSNNGIGDASI